MSNMRDTIKSILTAKQEPKGVVLQESEHIDEGLRTQINIYLEDVPEEKQQEILDAFMKALEDSGWKQMSMDDLVSASRLEEQAEPEEDLEELDDEELLSRAMEIAGTIGGGGAYVDNLIDAIGYDDLEYFLDDNPGVVSAIEGWIIDALPKVPEWKAKLLDYARDGVE